METNYYSKRLDHLGLVAGMFDELDIEKVIDENIPLSNSNRNISAGECVKAFILIGLGFVQRALYLTPAYLKTISIDKLFNRSLNIEYFNDDAMGHTLDRLYEFGTTSLFSKISNVACQKLSLDARFKHLDSTSFHVDGVYNSNNEAEDAVIKVTKGYSRDHRPELNQAILNLIVENKAGIPILMEAVNGNNSDKTDFPRIVNSLSSGLINPNITEYIVADSALYTQKGLEEISSDWKWITRVPETLKMTKEVIGEVNSEEMKVINEKYKYQKYIKNYADIKQRWLIVFSEDSYKREIKTLNKNLLKTTNKEMIEFTNLKMEEFACEQDAIIALNKFKKKCLLSEFNSIEIIKKSNFKDKGRPKKNAKPDFYTYQIVGNISISIEKKEKLQQKKGFFIIATNELDEEKLSDTELFEAYKNQGKVERGFRFLKDPQFMASTLFLKSPKRIEALMMIMTLSLLVYAALEYKTRQLLKEKNQTFPNQIDKEIQNPTMRWIFFYFKGIEVLHIKDKKEIVVLNLKDEHEKIIKLLGYNFENKYY